MIEVNAAGYQLSLFKKHFMVMNALYTLQAELIEEAVYLQISVLFISLQLLGAESPTTRLSDIVDSKLREYYLDWHNYDVTGAAAVHNLSRGSRPA